MNWRKHIVSDPNVLFGKPTIKGTRISVEYLLDRMVDGWDMDRILGAYPHVTRDDVLAALAFVSEMYKEESFVALGKARQ